jgi:hypothetical protein
MTSLFAAMAVSGALALAVPAIDTAAHAATHTTTGKLHSFTWNEDRKVGHLVLITPNARPKFKVTRDTDCGYSTGQSGDSIPCGSLDAEKYHGKPTRVQWFWRNGHKLASQVSVTITG